MIIAFNNRTVTVQRLKTLPGTSKKQYSATATADTNIQNIETEDSFTKEGVSRKAYKAWFDISQDIQVNDKLIDSETGDQYRVMGVEKIGDNLGISCEHLEVVMHKFTD